MLQYRCKLYRDAHAFRKPERTPYEVALQTWQFYDAGYTPAVASRNYEMMEECITRFFRTYPVDACRNIGLRMPLLLSDAVGGQSVTNDENLSAVDICYAAAKYMFRADKDYDVCYDAVQRGIRVAQGAAMMTDTKMAYKIESVVPNFYLNIPLSYYVNEAAQKVPPLTYTDEDYQKAEALYAHLHPGEPIPDRAHLIPTEIIPFKGEPTDYCSTSDCADMSYYCPAIQIWGLGKVVGTAGHHWTTTFASSNGIGMRAGLYGYAILAQTGYDALTDPEIVKKCWEAFHAQHIPEHPHIL